jgi:hypothetical protein
MRRVAILSVTLVTAAALAGAAFAQMTPTNTYVVQASVSPRHAGTKHKPSPLKLKFGLEIDAAGGARPAPVKTYKIDVYGVRTQGRHFPVCDASALAGGSATTCPAGSLIGSGTIESVIYPTNDPASTTQVSCQKSLAIYNTGQGGAVLLLTGPGSSCGGVGQSLVIPATYGSGSGGGSALSFTVPDNVRHPLNNVTVAVRSVHWTIARVTKKVKGVTHGYYESVGCREGKRPVKVTLTTEAGASAAAKTTMTCTK